MHHHQTPTNSPRKKYNIIFHHCIRQTPSAFSQPKIASATHRKSSNRENSIACCGKHTHQNPFATIAIRGTFESKRQRCWRRHCPHSHSAYAHIALSPIHSVHIHHSNTAVPIHTAHTQHTHTHALHHELPQMHSNSLLPRWCVSVGWLLCRARMREPLYSCIILCVCMHHK